MWRRPQGFSCSLNYLIQNDHFSAWRKCMWCCGIQNFFSIILPWTSASKILWYTQLHHLNHRSSRSYQSELNLKIKWVVFMVMFSWNPKERVEWLVVINRDLPIAESEMMMMENVVPSALSSHPFHLAQYIGACVPSHSISDLISNSFGFDHSKKFWNWDLACLSSIVDIFDCEYCCWDATI